MFRSAGQADVSTHEAPPTTTLPSVPRVCLQKLHFSSIFLDVPLTPPPFLLILQKRMMQLLGNHQGSGGSITEAVLLWTFVTNYIKFFVPLCFWKCGSFFLKISIK